MAESSHNFLTFWITTAHARPMHRRHSTRAPLQSSAFNART